jgi:hypothetical protein
MDDDNADLRAQLAEARTDKKFADMLGEVRIGFAGIEAKFAAVDGKFAALEGKFAAIDGKFAALEGKISGLDGKIGGLDGKIGGLDGKIGGLDGKIGGIEGRLSALEQSVAGLKPTIILTGLAVAALMVATLTYGQTWFGIGVSTRDIVRSTVAEYVLQHPAPQAK